MNPETTAVQESIATFMQALRSLGMASACVEQAQTDADRAKAQTLVWQASMALDDAADHLAVKVRVATEATRAEIRGARMAEVRVAGPTTEGEA